MSNTLTIAWRETQSYFSTPTAYVVGAMFLILTGIFFVFDVTRAFPEASEGISPPETCQWTRGAAGPTPR